MSESDQKEQMFESECEMDEIEASGSEEEEGGEEEDSGSGMENEGDDSNDKDEDGDDDEDEDERSEEDGSSFVDEESESEHEVDEKAVSEEDESRGGEKLAKDNEGAKVKNKLFEKYEKMKGKTLFVRFPHKLPTDQTELETKLKNICNRIIRVRRPRQKSVRFCLVDFESPIDRAKGLNELRKVEIEGKPLHVEYPKTEKEDLLQELVNKRLKKAAERKAKLKLKKAVKKEQAKAKNERVFTSTIIIQNIPAEAKHSEIKELFPQAIDVQMNFAKGSDGTSTATVTMPTPKLATIAQRKKHKMGENQLRISFAATKKSTVFPEKAPAQENGSASFQSPREGKRKIKQSTIEGSTPLKKKKVNKRNLVKNEPSGKLGNKSTKKINAKPKKQNAIKNGSNGAEKKVQIGRITDGILK